MEHYSTYYCSYTIGEDSYREVPEVCARYGTRILLIGGEKAMKAGRAKLDMALADTKFEIADAVLYGRDCTRTAISELADLAKELQVDMIFGMGGGKALDTAKARHGRPGFRYLQSRRLRPHVRQRLH